MVKGAVSCRYGRRPNCFQCGDARGTWPCANAEAGISGLGGKTKSVLIEPEALDINVLGRDITGLFAVIVDQPDGLVS